jgi:hypothetical protein
MDSADKRARHYRDLTAALRSGSMLPLRQLLNDADYPGDASRAVFYAQSLSLAEYLTQLDSPQQFMRFKELSANNGCDRALATVYGINTNELDSRWRKHAIQAVQRVR